MWETQLLQWAPAEMGKKEGLLKCLQKSTKISFFSLLAGTPLGSCLYTLLVSVCLFVRFTAVSKVFSLLSSILHNACVVLRCWRQRWEEKCFELANLQARNKALVRWSQGYFLPWTLFAMPCNLVHFKGKTSPTLKYLHETGLVYLFPENNKLHRGQGNSFPPSQNSWFVLLFFFQMGSCSQQFYFHPIFCCSDGL